MLERLLAFLAFLVLLLGYASVSRGGWLEPAWRLECPAEGCAAAAGPAALLAPSAAEPPRVAHEPPPEKDGDEGKEKGKGPKDEDAREGKGHGKHGKKRGR